MHNHSAIRSDGGIALTTKPHFARWKQTLLLGAAALSLVGALATYAATPTKQGTPATKPAADGTKSRAEVDKLIEEAGKTQPDWWDSTELNYPDTLDLTWGPGVKGKWDNKRVMGAYYWDIIDPNPARWKEGIKLAHYCLTNTLKANPKAQTNAMGTMSRIYTEMLGDFPRGAYWAKKHGNMPLTLAECYLKLGCPSAAKQILNGMGTDQTRNCQMVKLWAELGDMKTALFMAETRAKGDPTPAYLAAGDACRSAQRFPEAVAYYQKVIKANGSNRDDKVNKSRAQASLDAIKLFDSLDLSKIADGTYKGAGLGYVGDVNVEVTVAGNKIEKVEVTQHHEKQFYSSINDVPPQIVAKQSVKGVDTTTGATRTSEAIINGAAKALAAAQK